MHDPLTKRVLAALERTRPRPRWEFVFKNYTFWGLGAVAVLVGAVAFSAALFEVANAGWALYAATHRDFFTFFFAVAPFLWAVVLIVFIALGYVNIRRTERGYRYPLAVIALGAVLTSVTLGTALYATGFGAEVEEALGDHPPFYRPIMAVERAWWVDPSEGLIAGSVVSAASTTRTFIMKDFHGATWVVNGEDLSAHDLVVLARGGVVRLVGLPATTSIRAAASSTERVFHACFAFPWKQFGLGTDEPPPPPVAVFSFGSASETNPSAARSDVCKGIRPYEMLRTVDENGF